MESRREMELFWKQHSSTASLVEMFLDSNADEIAREEKPEILSFLPDYNEKRVLELGAGIGRFTGDFASKAKHVTTVEFMRNFLEENKKANARFANIDYLCSDVTQLDLDDSSYDFIFSNWLLMYLNDDEVSSVLTKILRWLPEGGYLFFHESCFFQSGNKKREFNPTHYRSPLAYGSLIDSIFLKEANNKLASFQLIWARSLQSYIRLKSNPNQLCWLYKKVTSEGVCEAMSTQQFLDKQQYTINGILRYERIFGAGYISTGGPKTTEKFVATLDLKPGQRVIDVGCGIGGGDYYMADKYGVFVLGIDLSSNMISVALEQGLNRHKHLQDKVQFEICDVTAREYPECSFDVIYSRDTILHIKDKDVLFKKLYKWLKVGGRLLISDYCCGPQPWSDVFKAYVTQRGYNLLEPAQYGKVLETAGFVNVQANDCTDMFVECLREEVSRTEKEKEAFLEDFSPEDYSAITDGWKAKIERCQQGDQKWGLFTATK
ncbi:uncharacterized protein [Oscarella lobularis]|uniref:uncharacterized protein n=1 Tax=Oscarella lobularis TaxID=121494 RepID=UPI00331340DB